MTSRNGQLLFLTGVITFLITLVLVFDLHRSREVLYLSPEPSVLDPVVARVNSILSQCDEPDEFELLFGRPNIRMTRSYEGSLFRLERFLNKAIRGDDVVIGIIGGSVSAGHGVELSERWDNKLLEYTRTAYPGSNITIVNGAIPASGSDYFSFCFPLHIPSDVDLVFVELGVNDEPLMEHSDNMDNLLRGLLDLPNDPAVILLELAAFSTGRMAGGGGRMHLSVAQYYDVPVLNQRWPLVTHFARFPQLVPHYFVKDWWGPGTDTRHIGPKGHHDVARIISSLFRDTTCAMVSAPEYIVAMDDVEFNLPIEDKPDNSYDQQLKAIFGNNMSAMGEEVLEIQKDWPSETRQWTHEPSGEDLKKLHIQNGARAAPGLWMPPTELGLVPRLRGVEDWDWDVSHVSPPFRPQCRSTRSPEPAFNLTPIATIGWHWWVMNTLPDKPYIIANVPGSQVTFQLEINIGIIKMYSLRSMVYGFGMVDCWIDNDVDHKTKIDGYWDNPGLNIGRFSTLSENLEPGTHNITCQLLRETNDPQGRTSFRIISIMGV